MAGGEFRELNPGLGEYDLTVALSVRVPGVLMS